MHISHRCSCPLFSLSVAVVVVFFPFFRLVFSGPAILALEVVLLPGDRVALSFVFPCVFLPVLVFRSFLLLKIITANLLPFLPKKNNVSRRYDSPVFKAEVFSGLQDASFVVAHSTIL
jgi:hypothetical protein